jgi:uncharacterized protein (TIGR02266 family)
MVVLFVEDSDFYLQFRRGFFGRLGCRILNARSVAEAEESVAEEKPDLTIVSNLLPDGAGADLCRRLAAGPGSGARCILITDPGDSDLEPVACDERVVRPVDPDDLMERISRLLGIEQRSSERIDMQVEVVYGSRRDQITGTCRNVSPDGMLIETGSALKVGTRVELDFKLPGQGETLHVVAEVIRHARLAGKDRHTLGLRFSDPDPSVQGKIRDILD